METIVIGYDETEPARRALDRAVQPPVRSGPEKESRSIEISSRQRGSRSATPESTSSSFPPPANPRTRSWKSRTSTGADLIVVGTRDPGIIERLLGQSVSESVARQADCDVMIVR